VRPRRANVIQRNRVRPLRCQQLPAVGILFDMGNNLKSGSRKAYIETADASE
jgi:hypothetical protein